MKLRGRTFDWGLLVALLLPLIAALPTWGAGVVAGADTAVHVHRVHAMTLALQDGTLWPRWISYLHLGYGYPIFNFYAPGATYLTALFELTGLHITTAYNLVQTLAWSFGSAGMYLLARRFLPVPGALLAAALWTFAPSRLYEVWWQGSLAQIVSASFIPWLLLGVARNAAQTSLRAILSIALPFAALILTHTPMMYISALYATALAFFAPLWSARGKLRVVARRWLFIGAGFALGMGLAAIFLLPTLLELRYVQISQGIDETTNYLVEQFLPAAEIFTLPPLLDETDLYLNLPRTLGLVGGLLSAAGLLALLRKRRYGLALLLAAGMGVTLFMLLESSLPVWLTIPGFANLRFPARLLRVGAVLVGLLGGASLLWLPTRYQLAGSVVASMIVIAQILPITKPHDGWLNWENISALDEVQHEAEAYTWGTVSYDEFNPIWGERVFLDVPPAPERYEDQPFHLRVFERDLAELGEGLQEESLDANTLRITTDKARAVRFRQYYFPGWRATVDGEPAEIYPEDYIGLITIDLPAGEHIVTLDYVGTSLQHASAAISLFSVLIVLVLFSRWKPAPQTTVQQPISARSGMILSTGVLVLALLNHFVVQPNDWLKIQSAPDAPYSMQQEVGAVFGDEVELLGYTLHSEGIAPGSPLHIDLYWRALVPLENDYRPEVQLVSLTQSAAWAVSAPIQPAAGKTSTFATDRYARDPHTLRLINEDVPPYVGQIRVQLIGEDGPLQLPDGSYHVLLDVIIPIDTAGDAAQGQNSAPYVFGDVVELVCGSAYKGDATIFVDLQWRITGATDEELVVMVHGLDENGDLVQTGDGPPFHGDYPSYFWRAGLVLQDRQRLTVDFETRTVAIGLYTRDDIQRLPVTQNGEPQENNQVLLPLGEPTCSP